MLRQATRGVIALVLFAAVLDSAGRARQPAAADRVFYRDKKDGVVRNVAGELKPTPTGYQVYSATDKKVVATVSPADVIRVAPGEIPGYEPTAVTDLVKLEDAGQWEKARATYQEMFNKAKSAPEKVRKYLEFRVGIAAAHAADAAADEAAARAKGEEAVKLLDNFLTGYKTGYEVYPAAETAARLQLSLVERKKDGDKETERRQFDEAARTWGKLAKNAGLPPDLRTEAGLQEIDLKIRARQYSDAAALVGEMMKSAPAGSVKDRLAIYQLALNFVEKPNPADGVPPIEAAIAKTTDPMIRAAGYGMMGELYLAAGKPRDAMWQYLWVEVVYNRDKDEVLKALVRLADTFRMQGDEDRARQYRDKARRLRAGL